MKCIVVRLGELDNEVLDDKQKVQTYLLDLQQKGESVSGEVILVIENTPVGLGDPVFKKLKATLTSAFMGIGAIMGVRILEGIDAGISNGETIKIHLFIKAPSTKGKLAQKGRHDPCIVPRVIPVIESMAYIVLANHYLYQKIYATK